MAVINYQTRDGLAEYGFSIEFVPDVGWRVYIVFQPHGGSLELPYQSIDSTGRHYVDWSAKLDSLGDARTVAALWAELVHNYQRSVDIKQMIDSPLPVSVYLEDGQESTIGHVMSALKTIGDKAGFELVAENAPICGSFWQKFRAKASDPRTQREVGEWLIKVGRAAEVQGLAVPESEANMQNAQGLALIIEALKGEPAAVIQLGPLVVVKVRRPDGESAILGRILTAKELRMLEVDPGLLKDPIVLMARLTNPGEGKQIEQAP